MKVRMKISAGIVGILLLAGLVYMISGRPPVNAVSRSSGYTVKDAGTPSDVNVDGGASIAQATGTVAAAASEQDERRMARAVLEAPDLQARFEGAMSEAEQRSLEVAGVLFNNPSKRVIALRRDPSVIVMRNALIDTSVIAEGGPSVAIPEAYRASEDTQRFIVQFDGKIDATQRAVLTEAGAIIEHYVPNRAFAVTADADTLDALRARADVRHIEPFHPYFKMSPEVQAYLLGPTDAAGREHVEKGEFRALLFSGADVAVELESLGVVATSRRTVGEMDILEFDCPAELLPDVVKADCVQWVEARLPMKPANDLANWTTQAYSVKYTRPGLDGSGVIVAVADSGVDHTHLAFSQDPGQSTYYDPASTNTNTRIIHYEARTSVTSPDGELNDLNGHGTHVSASILGNGGYSRNVRRSPGSEWATYGTDEQPYQTNQFAGIAPQAQLVMIEDFNGYTDVEMGTIAYGHGARLMNNSWGNSMTVYGIMSAAWDARVRDADDSEINGNQELSVFFAAGNDGGGSGVDGRGNPGTVGQPGNAKNVITVGAVEQRRLADNLPAYGSLTDTDAGWQVTGFSSRGPTPDGRVKPDIVAPGGFVISAQSKDVDFDDVNWPDGPTRDYHHGNLDTGTNYAAMSGTSMASPIACGVGALVYQYFTEAFGVPPKPATLKAMLVNGAYTLDSIYYEMQAYGPDVVEEGWGLVDLARTIDGPRAHIATDEVIVFNQQDEVDEADTVEVKTIEVTGDDAGGLKITLAWTDAPGNPDTGIVLQNDLDLVVVAPDGKYYLGNVMGRLVWGTASHPFTSDWDGAYGDRYNNVETVVIRDAQPGNYEIRVVAENVPYPPQDFSLVIMRGHSSLGDNGGGEPAIAMDAGGYPVVAAPVSETGAPDDLGNIGVRHWVGGYGDNADFERWRRMRGKWFHYGDKWSSELISGQVAGSQTRQTTVAVNQTNGNVYVAWQYQSFDTNDSHAIYFKYWDNAREEWRTLGRSHQDYGICDPDVDRNDAHSPSVGIAWDGHPAVAYVQGRAIQEYDEVVVRKWDPVASAWVTLGGPGTVANPLGRTAHAAMVMDTNGYPVVVARELSYVKVYRWNGSAWAQVGGQLGSGANNDIPAKIAIDGDDIYVTWTQQESPPYTGGPVQTIRVARWDGSAWVGLGVDNSMTTPGVSGTNDPCYNPQIAVANDRLFVAFQVAPDYMEEPDLQENRIKCIEWDGAVWQAAGIDRTGSEGLVRLTGRSKLTALAVNHLGHPVFGVSNNRRNGIVACEIYGLVGALEAPPFKGIATAEGTASNTVELGWAPVFDPRQTITYHIYQTPGSGWAADDPSRPGPLDPTVISDAFGNEIATVVDLGSYTVTNLPADRVWYFGVRAENEAGLMDPNTKLLLAGPYNADGDSDRDWLPTIYEREIGTDPINPDTDGDGMWDGWEWYYSYYNTGQVAGVAAHVGSLAMDPFDNGFDNILTPDELDGTDGLGAYDDLDGDGLFNIEEFQYWLAHAGTNLYSLALAQNPTNWWLNPTLADTDGDTMPDGWEALNDGLDPGDPGDGDGDPDGDGLVNTNELYWGTDPDNPDSDYDGVNDGDEVAAGSLPFSADSDGDGLDDDIEATVGGNVVDRDSNNNDLNDGREFELGYTNVAVSRDLANYIVLEDCESSSYTNWLMSAQVSLWHRSRTEPSELDDPTELVGGIEIGGEYEHTTNYAFRMALDEPPYTNLNATYDLDGSVVEARLVSPVFNPVLAGAVNLYVSWNEYYQTEAEWDTCEVFAGTDGVNWKLVREARSGFSYGWQHEVADLNEFVGESNVRVMFKFKTKDGKDNAFRGWWVDDIKIYGATRISGTVRDLNGAPIEGANVFAIGRRAHTNQVTAHRYILPATIFERTETDIYGNYTLDGLFQGQYYVKVSMPGYRSEFWDGRLYTGPYLGAFGGVLRHGVRNQNAVSTNGIVNLATANATETCNFELEPGANGGRLGIVYADAPKHVYVGQFVTNEFVWNGVTNAAGGTNLQWMAYTTTNSLGSVNEPDYIDNPVMPTLMDNLAAGKHDVWLSPGWTNMPLIPKLSATLRDGEVSLITVATNQAASQINVRADVGGYEVWVDGRYSGTNTMNWGSPVTVDVLEGYHDVTLVTTNGDKFIAPKTVHAPSTGRAIAWFNEAETDGPMGSVLIETVDFLGNTVTNAKVFLNGWPLMPNAMGPVLTTPAVVSNLVAGSHVVTVRKEGYRPSKRYVLAAYSNVQSKLTIPLSQADADYDGVGDAREVAGYQNLFMYHRDDDPDQDGVPNLVEDEIFRFYNVRMNLFDADSDDDELSDGQELGYDGNTNSYGLSELAAGATFNSGIADVYFRGRYLDGVSYLPIPGPGVVRLSLEGDQVKASALSWTQDAYTAPVLRYGLLGGSEPEDTLNTSHITGTPTFSDTYPDRPDSDGDVMWDGWESRYEYSVALLNPLEAARGNEDPDHDRLVNVKEFLGFDQVANTNDYLDPTDGDTDNDFMPDGWELEHELDPRDRNDAFEDPDHDDLINVEEYLYRTDPYHADSDGDLLGDGDEVHTFGSDPTLYDTDGDGLSDGREVVDSDGDPSNGLDGGIFPGLDGTTDMDDDGNMDGPTDWDTDGDGMPDGFEVLDPFTGEVRPEDERLDPTDPFDADLDYDGDGLSNLQEWLIRDNQLGAGPQLYGYSVDLIWDYPTDPFDADTDEDGMPDGWEAFYGLHPMDPIPNPETQLGWLIRYPGLWLFGDPDADGVHNRNEYDYRFVIDPGIDPDGLDGSLHPLVRDTDEDGLIDGDEIKLYRADPLSQDTDGDGLMDGQAVGMPSEIQTDTNTTVHLDRALNDVWVLKAPDDPPGGLVVWEKLQEDGPVTYADIYGMGTNAYVMVEVESQPFTDPTAWPRVPIIPDIWQTKTNDAYSPPAEWVDDYLHYTGFIRLPDVPDTIENLLIFKVNVSADGVYRFKMHCYYPYEGGGEDPYHANSFWLKVDNMQWRKMAVEPGVAGNWTWNVYEVLNESEEVPEGTRVRPAIPLTAGLHTIQISGRASDLHVDRFVLYHTGLIETDMSGTTLDAISESTPVAVLPLRPERRWGAAAGAVQFEVRDGAAKDAEGANVHSRGDTYVGGIVAQSALANQVLVASTAYQLFGGRDGITRFNEIWDLRGGALWEKIFPQPGQMPPLADVSGAVGDAYLVAATRHGVVSEAFGTGRPRPGSAPAYIYYDGDPTTDPLAIWGEDGAANSAQTPFITGGYNGYIYYGGYVHDAVEEWGLPDMARLPKTYRSADDDPTIIYGWDTAADAYQVNRWAPALDDDGNGVLWVGSTGTTTNDVMYTGINIGPVLNTGNDYLAEFGSAGMAAFLEFAVVEAVTNSFQIEVWAELYDDPEGTSAERIEPHGLLTSPTAYLASQDGFAPGVRDAEEALWTFSTTRKIVTIEETEADETVQIDVSDQVAEALGAVYTGGGYGAAFRWELGSHMGFVIRGTTNAPGTLAFREERPKLRIIVTQPPWVQEAAISQPMQPVRVPYQRKSSAMEYDDAAGQFTLFGGVDGNRVLDDTWVSADGVAWQILYPAHRPPARWAHGMVSYGQGLLVFGGFDKDNRPLNDLWRWDGNDWTEIDLFVNTASGEDITVYEKPAPRGGMMFEMLDAYPALFGGTDGERYFNDTWVLQPEGVVTIATSTNLAGGATNSVETTSSAWRWILCQPNGYNWNAPPARAFPAAAKPANGGITMFGGRCGTLPTATDTDQDWVDDGVELDLGGPNAGRDPRVNAMIPSSLSLNTNAVEKLPYAFKRFGGLDVQHSGNNGWTWFTYIDGEGWDYDGWPIAIPRPPIASFESLAHPHEPDLETPEWKQVRNWGFPFEGRKTPPLTIHWFESGYEALMVQSKHLWWHQFGGNGEVDDPRDEWRLGAPHGPAGVNTTPPLAYSGRWCFGTDLDGTYENNAIMDLYTPIIDLSIPAQDSTTWTSDQPLNYNDYYLVFHEWLDLADENDYVSIQAIRPTTRADVLQRVSDPLKPPVDILPRRNNEANTDGEWRRVIVPVTLTESNLFFKFTLQSDEEGNAGGWYIDDVAIVQAGEINGGYLGSGQVRLYGIRGTNALDSTTAQDGAFRFSLGQDNGFLMPVGEYRLVGGDGSMSLGTVAGGDGTWTIIIPLLEINEIVVGISINSPAKLQWNAVPGAAYEVQYSTPELVVSDTPWRVLATVRADQYTETYIDYSYESEESPSRFYRIVMTETP
jgi:serine protease AprX